MDVLLELDAAIKKSIRRYRMSQKTIETKKQSLEQTRKPSREHERLNIFVGRWKTEGMVSQSPSRTAMALVAIDTYEWLPGGFFLLHRVDGHMGDDEVKTTEIIGFKASNQLYFSQSFNNQGNANTYQASLDEKVWKIFGDSERFTGSFSDDGNNLIGKWERVTDGSNWVPWIDIKLTKET
jgi:hypothetical protein